MSRGFGLVIGVKSCDPATYGQTFEQGCTGAYVDVQRVSAVLQGRGFSVRDFRAPPFGQDPAATGANVMAELSAIFNQANSGDIVVFYVSAHGRQTLQPGGGFAESMLMHDQAVFDYQLTPIWHGFAAGVRIVAITDTCSSETIVGLAPNDPQLRASVVHFAACADAGKARGYPSGSLFTTRLFLAWCGMKNETEPARCNYGLLFSKTKMPSDMAHVDLPQHHAYGPNKDALLRSAAFKI